MGNFHCIPSGCAKVVYREYLQPKIRWRYPDEDWQEITGDDYTLDQKFNLCDDGRYNVRGTYICKANSESLCNKRLPFVNAPRNYVNGRISHFSRDIYNNLIIVSYYRNPANQRLFEDRTVCINPDRGLSVVPTESACTGRNELNASNDFSTYEITSVQEISGRSDCSECTFTITQNSQVVHTETREVCPEVEKINCSLSDEYKEIKIKKFPWLSSIAVNNYGREFYELDIQKTPYPVPILFEIPNECLNIYRMEIFDPLTSGYDSNSPNEPVFGDYIAQICSASGCSPPEYQVICDCDSCENCPPNTCAVNCHGQICCYDTATGKAVKQIALSNYCGGTN